MEFQVNRYLKKYKNENEYCMRTSLFENQKTITKLFFTSPKVDYLSRTSQKSASMGLLPILSAIILAAVKNAI